MESTRAVLEIPGNSARFYVSSPDKRTNSCDQQTEYVSLEHFSGSPHPPASPPSGSVRDSPSLRLTASKAKPNVHLVPAFFMLFLFLFLRRRRRRSARLVYYALLHARFSVLPFIVLPPLNCCEIFCNN